MTLRDTHSLTAEQVLATQLGSLDEDGTLPLMVDWTPYQPATRTLHMLVIGNQNSEFPVQIELSAEAPHPEFKIVCRAPPGSSTETPVRLFSPGMSLRQATAA